MFCTRRGFHGSGAFTLVVKKAFSDLEVFSAFAGDVLGVRLRFSKVEREKAFLPPVGKVDVRFDLYGEDEENRVVGTG